MEVRLGLATPHLVMGEGQACLVSGWVRVTWRREGLARRFRHALTLTTRACLRSSLTSAGCADSPSAPLSNLPPRREPTSDVSCPLVLSGLLQHCLARLNAQCREAGHAHLVSAADQCRRRGAAARRGRDARLYRFLRLPAESNRAWTASCRQLTPFCRRTGRFRSQPDDGVVPCQRRAPWPVRHSDSRDAAVRVLDRSDVSTAGTNDRRADLSGSRGPHDRIPGRSIRARRSGFPIADGSCMGVSARALGLAIAPLCLTAALLHIAMQMQRRR
jgi:hypothetical protein